MSHLYLLYTYSHIIHCTSSPIVVTVLIQIFDIVLFSSRPRSRNYYSVAFSRKIVSRFQLWKFWC